MLRYNKRLLHTSKLSDINFIFTTPNTSSCNTKGKLYLGSHFGVNQDIKSVLTIMEGSEYYRHNMKERLRQLVESKTVSNHKHIVLDDPIIDSWSISSQFIHEQLENTNVFVHCVYGKSRSPSAVAAYLISMQKFTVDEACRLIQSKRDIRFEQFWKNQLKNIQHIQ